MMRSITILALCIGLAIPSVASAQWRGSGNGRGWNGNGSPNNGNWNNGYRNNGYRNYGNNSYYGFGLGLGGVYGGYIQNGGFYGGLQTTPYNGYYLNDVNVYPGGRNSSAYFDATAGNADNNLVMNANRARVEVITADSNAVLLIQGQRMEIRGRSNVFISSDLTAGKTFTYSIVMRLNKLEDTRTIEVRAGSDVTVDFTKPADKAMPMPSANKEEKTLPLPR